ncbi:hypothetical protein Pla100_38100 [Neorhodopirellula pilleata]|uniref:Uncharacterized protein n=1 Tax=Neorhodopirellula pilleata TaxID=2714738 RepID=A0A5C6A4A9_9BACT|nr:hypothetical protein Pla100_38100 [Neorhodopirellula pilleata]
MRLNTIAWSWFNLRLGALAKVANGLSIQSLS